MKKLLALVLALVMTLGLATVGASAAFTDDADVDYDEAVEVMNGLQILEGYADGSFQPDKILNRAEAAKIIAYMCLGKKTADSLNVKAPFTDTQGHWAEAYIAYCSSQGIIVGINAEGTIFNPTGELTGYAFAKMVLCALGYDADTEGFRGTAWEINVAKLVASLELNDGMESVPLSQPMSREAASQMAFNALTTPTVKFTKGTTVAGTGLTISTGGTYALAQPTLLATVYSGSVDYGYIDANSANDATAKLNGTTHITKIAADSNKLDAVAKTFGFETDKDLVGHYVAVYYKDTWTSTSTPGTTYAIIDKTVETPITKSTTAAAVKSALTASGYNTSGANIVFAEQFANGAQTTPNTTITLGTTSGAGAGARTLLGYYDETNKVVEPYGSLVADTYTVDKVTSISTTSGKESITLRGIGQIANNASSDKVNEYEGIAKDDVVFVYNYNGGQIYNLEKPTIVTGKASTKNTDADAPTVTVNGTKYSVSLKTNNSGETDVALAGVGYTNEYNLYLDKNDKVAMITGVEASTDLVYAIAVYSKAESDGYAATSRYYLQGVTLDGTEVNYLVYHNDAGDHYKMNETQAANNDAVDEIVLNRLYSVTTAYDDTVTGTVSGGKSGTYATLTSVAVNGATKGSANKNNAALTSSAKVVPGNATYYFASDVKFIYAKGTLGDLKLSVVDGMQNITASGAINWTAYGTKTATATNYDVHYVFVAGASVAPSTSSSAIAFGAESSASTSTVPYTTSAGNTATAYEHTVYVDGEAKTILTTTNTAISGFKTLTEDSATGITTVANYSTSTNVMDIAGATVTGAYNGLLTTTSGTSNDSTNTNATNADISKAKIIDLTKNNIETYSRFESLVACGGTVNVAYVYDSANATGGYPVSIVYITKATFAAGTITDAGTTMTLTSRDSAVGGANVFGTGNANIAATDGVTYAWSRSAAASDADYSSVADSNALTLDVSGDAANLYYKCKITVQTTTGFTFTATAAAVQNT